MERDKEGYYTSLYELAAALNSAGSPESIQKDCETFRRDRLEWRAALGHEWMVGESVTPSEG